MHIAVCDDQPEFMQEFIHMISSCLNGQHIPYELSAFTNGSQLLESVQPFDILFLDIRMEGLSGLDTARRFRQSNSSSKLVFLTAYKQYVFQAFDVDASQYLLKPVSEERLCTVLTHLIQQIEKRDTQALLIHTKSVTRRILLEQTDYIEVINRKVYFHMRDGDVFDCYDQIEHLKEQLPSHFYRCHRSYIVNLDSVQSYDRKEISLFCGQRVPLSKQKYDEFSKSLMNRYRKDKI